MIKIRPTGILIEDGKILLLDQDVNNGRKWSLPGGTMEEGETLEACLKREMMEETGLEVKVIKMLYLAELSKEDKYVLHITFLVEKVGGELGKTTDIDTHEIRSVEMVPIDSLENLGFSPKFVGLVKDNFPGAGTYVGSKSNIGL